MRSRFSVRPFLPPPSLEILSSQIPPCSFFYRPSYPFPLLVALFMFSLLPLCFLSLPLFPLLTPFPSAPPPPPLPVWPGEFRLRGPPRPRARARSAPYGRQTRAASPAPCPAVIARVSPTTPPATSSSFQPTAGRTAKSLRETTISARRAGATTATRSEEHTAELQ